MQARVQIVAILAFLALIVVVFELVRRRRLMERYALLWLFVGVVLLALAIFKGLLSGFSSAIGIFYPPSALFVAALGFIAFVLLHFSMAVSSLTDQNKIMAQRLALMEKRLRDVEGAAVDIVEERSAEEPANGEIFAAGGTRSRERG